MMVSMHTLILNPVALVYDNSMYTTYDIFHYLIIT